MRTLRPFPLTASIALILATAAPCRAAQPSWNNPGTETWFSGTNWSKGTVPGAADDASVTNGGTSQIDGELAATAHTLTIDNASTVRILANSSLSVGRTDIGAGTLEIGDATGSATYTGDVHFTTAFGVLRFANSASLASIISGSGKVQVTGGTVTLTGANTYAGGTSISNFATVAVNSDAALGASSGRLGVNNGTLRLLNSFNTARPIAISNVFGVDTNGFNSTFSGVISGSGLVDKTGPGTLRLTGKNTYTGATAIEGGVLEIASNANLGAPSANLDIFGGTLRLLGSMTVPRSGAISGATIDTNGFTGTFTGSFSGEGGGLTKIGPGTLVLGGRQTYFGDTVVQDGILILKGSVAFNVIVGSGGEQAPQFLPPAASPIPVFEGSGTVGGSLVNFGIVSPGNVAGKLTVNGNYTQGANGTLLLQIGGHAPNQFDRLVVGGQANLAGTAEFDSLNNFTPSKGDRFVFLTAAGGINGKFSTISLDLPLLKGIVQYSATSAALTFGQQPILPLFEKGGEVVLAPGEPPVPVGLTPNQIAVAKTLDRAINDDRLSPVFNQLDRLSLPAIPSALDLISPEALSAIYEIGIGTGDVQAFNLEQHLSDLRGGARGFNAYRFAFGGSPTKDGKTTTDYEGKQTKDVFTPAPDNRWSVFISGSGEFLDIDNSYNARGYGISTGGFTVGADYRVTDNFAVGVLAGYAGTGADLTEGGRISVDSGKFGLYATGFGKNFYVNALAEGGYNSYDVRLHGLGGDAQGETEGGEFNGLLSTGYDFHHGSVTAGPILEGQYTYVGYDGFREHGSVAPLDVLSNSSDSLRLRLGGHAATIVGSGFLKLRPNLELAWQHEFLDTTRPTDASFASGAGDVFRVEGPQIGRDSLILNASLTLFCGERWSTYLAYYGQLARKNYSSNTISGGVQMSF